MPKISIGENLDVLMPKLVTDMDDMWRNNHLYDEYKRDVSIFSTVTSKQQVNLPAEFLNMRDCRECKVKWLCDDCDFDVNECGEEGAHGGECDITGVNPIAFDYDTYSPDPCCESKHYEVCETSCDTLMSFNEQVAHLLMKQAAQLDYALVKKLYLAIQSNLDGLDHGDTTLPDEYGLGGIGEGGIWEIGEGLWDEKMIAKLQCMFDDCMWNNPCMLVGNLWREDRKLYEARTGQGCCDSKGLLFSQDWITNESYFFNQCFPGQNTALLFDASDFAYYNMYRNENFSPERKNGEKDIWRWRVPSRLHTWRVNNSVRPVYYDVYAQWKCKDLDNDSLSFFMRHNGGYLKGPKGCEGKPTFLQLEQPCIDC